VVKPCPQIRPPREGRAHQIHKKSGLESEVRKADYYNIPTYSYARMQGKRITTY
jgi:hypothetical protein